MKHPHAFIAHTGIATIVLLCCFFATGCLNFSELVQPALEVNYYTLEYEPPSLAEAAPAPVVIGINEFTASPLYATGDMIYKKKDFLVAEYVYHRWRTPPAGMITYLLERDTRATGRYRGVYGPDGLARARYIIEGSVDKFLENDATTDWRAELAISITLRDAGAAGRDGDGIVFQKHYETSQPCARNNPRAFAEAMSLAMKRLSAAIITDVHEKVKEG